MLSAALSYYNGGCPGIVSYFRRSYSVSTKIGWGGLCSQFFHTKRAKPILQATVPIHSSTKFISLVEDRSTPNREFHWPEWIRGWKFGIWLPTFGSRSFLLVSSHHICQQHTYMEILPEASHLTSVRFIPLWTTSWSMPYPRTINTFRTSITGER